MWCMIPIYGDGLLKKAARYENFDNLIFHFTYQFYDILFHLQHNSFVLDKLNLRAFKASSYWLIQFKRQNKIVTRKITKV